MPHYVYAIVPSERVPAVEIAGIGRAPVGLRPRGRLAALVSELPKGRLRPQRRNLKAHQDVLTHVLGQQVTPLPFAFGTVVPSDEDLDALLEQFGEDFEAQLARVEGCLEHGIKIRWDVEDVFAHVLTIAPDLAALRDRTFAAGQPSQDALIDLGRAFDATRQALRDAATERIRAALEPVSKEVRVNPPKGEGDLADVALLVPTDGRPALDAAIATLAETFDDTHIIDVTGPWAPYSFVDLQLG